MNFSDLNVLRFNYLTLHLRKQNWRNFIKKSNPVAAAFLSKMGYSEDERIQVELKFLRMIANLKLNREKNSLLIGFFESYLQLNEEEKEILMKEAKELENAEEILDLPISYEERGKEKGKEIGKEIGREEKEREVALKMLREDIDVEMIMKFTQLEREEIEALRRQL